MLRLQRCTCYPARCIDYTMNTPYTLLLSCKFVPVEVLTYCGMHYLLDLPIRPDTDRVS